MKNRTLLDELYERMYKMEREVSRDSAKAKTRARR